MFDIFMYAANALLPIILLIAIGAFFRKRGLMDTRFMNTGNKLTFRFFLPAMVLQNIYDIEDLGSIRWNFVLFCILAVLVLFALGLVIALVFVKEKPSRGVFLQCTFRSNYAVIGLPLVNALGGSEGMAVAAVLTAFIIPVFNVLAVISLSLFSGGEGQTSPKKVIRTIVTNPLIIAAVIGMLILVIRSLLPENVMGEPVFTIRRDLSFLYDALASVSKATTAFALVVLGGLLDFSAVKGKLKNILLGTFMRTVFAPALGLSAAVLLDKAGILSLGAGEYASLIALFGSPVAVSSAIMAAEMDGDAELARQYVVWTSICPIVTIFAIVVLFKSTGLL